MFFRKKPKQFGKLKYTYGRTPEVSGRGFQRNRKRLIWKSSDPRKSRKIKIISLIVLLFGFILCLVYFLFFSGYFSLKNIKVTQEGLTENSKMLDKYFQKLKNKNLILINTSDIKEKIEKDHPEFDNIKIKKIYPKTIEVDVSEYPIAANLINVTGDTQKKYIINSIGLSIQENTENPNLPYIKIKSDEPLDAKGTLIQKEKLEYIVGAIDYFQDKFAMKIFEAEYLVKARETHLKTEKYFYIWLDTTQPFSEQLQKLKKVVPKLDIYNMPLSYIDLRISGVSGEKIIYKKR